MKRLFLLVALLTVALSCYAFEDATIAVQASQYQQLIRNTHAADSANQATREKAERYFKQKLWEEAISAYESLIAAGSDDTSTWLRLNNAWQARYNKEKVYQHRERALQAAYNAYRAANTTDEQARALFMLGELFIAKNQPRLAIAAFKEGLGLEENADIAKRYQLLLEANAFRVQGVDVEADSARPKICLHFTDTLSKNRQIHYQDYLVIKPATDVEVSAREQKLCLEGISHGQTYDITVRPGVPSASGEKTRNTETFTSTVADREPSLGFRGATYVLPQAGTQYLPLTSVNLNNARLKLLRINDRNLTQEINDRRITKTLSGYDIRTISDKSGESVWEGELAIEKILNQETTTAIPIADILIKTEPGIYVISAERTDEKLGRYEDRAAQWLVVSDLGLSSFTGNDGLHVFVRSLDNAGPLAGIELRLYSRNNTKLGQALTDENGYAGFDPGLLRGSGGREAAALMAYSKEGDFNFLDLTGPAFDLTDRGVAGRETLGPVDVFLYTERGVYRPGETVELMALMRDSRGYALPNLPLTLKIIRPDQVEVDRPTLTEAALGGYHHRIPLPGNARSGAWTVRAYTDPDAQPVGQLMFQVEDFVPQALKLDLETQAKLLQPAEPVAVALNGRFLYGAPAADLKAEAELVLREDKDPYPMHGGYQFGLVQDEWNAKQYPVDLVGTDGEGKAQINLRLNETPDISKPLKAVLRVSLFEPGGRPVNRTLELPYRPRPFAIGIRPQFEDDTVQIGADAKFSVIAVDPQGQPLAVNNVRYELIREDYEYYWYYVDNRWDYKLIIRDSTVLDSKTININAEQPTAIAKADLDWGAYRLEAFDADTGVATSVRFRVGWYGGPSEGDTPDQLKITLNKPRFQNGETAQVHVKAPFAGELLLTVVGDRLWTTRSLSLPAEGMTIELPIANDWGPGVYLTATAFRPAANPEQRGPGRAIGVTWLELDPQPRTLDIALQAPTELRPRQTFELPIMVTGVAPDQAVYLTLAAVDEGILQLTDFVSPNPVDYFLGKRKLGMDLRDLYGKLIESGGRPGQLRVGGGAESRNLDSSGVRTVKTVALFSGPVKVDTQGQARISLELPDFNGELRVMAVAWDQTRVGHADAPLLVRDPLVIQGYLPQFLAPEDLSQFTLNVQNLSAAAGDYRIQLSTSGAVTLDGETDFVFSVADTATQNAERKLFPLQALNPGVGRITLQVSGPDFTLQRDWEIGVRPAQAIVTERRASRLSPNETLTANATLLQDYLPDSGQVQLSFATRPNLDVPGLLTQLDRYPYGCVEQTTSQALPLLYFNQVAQNWGSDQQASLRDRVQRAIQRILAMQGYDGGFGLWNADSSAERWLSAYALDFLARAKQENYLVPESAYRRGLNWLKDGLADTETTHQALLAKVYASYVLARAEQATLGDLRYLHDNNLHDIPTVLGRAQLGAALARYGEMGRAREAFEAAFDAVPERADWRDYGSPLRDRAALIALLNEAGLLLDRVPQLAEEVAAELANQPYTSTQEQAWLLLAANALAPMRSELNLTVDGEPAAVEQNSVNLQPTAAQLTQGLNIANTGSESVWTVQTLSGVPVKPQPVLQQGFSITRRFYTRTGQEVDLTQVRRNDKLIAVISGEALTQEKHQALVVDLLPAGLEIENARLAHGQSIDEYRWLPELSETLHTEFRDDRFVAALDLAVKQREFTVAYLVRAVTPGDYRLPAVFVEDMYKPWYLARDEMGIIKIQ
ncbi:MAG: alpha-2-macroglobulin [Candidatus Competibacteraceae bacterium]|jgi:uncharacterized protein YfaS (alpha-2-macroglobulin family)|nr:alpha-2-macroglobulin [Candidatus Competibacteraceae bacterium]